MLCEYCTDVDKIVFGLLRCLSASPMMMIAPVDEKNKQMKHNKLTAYDAVCFVTQM